MPGVSQKMLSATLQSLVHDGLAAGRVEPTVPPRVYYRLTVLGLSLEPRLLPGEIGPSSTWPRSGTTSRPDDVASPGTSFAVIVQDGIICHNQLA